MKLWNCTTALVAALGFAAPVAAQEYPAKPVRLIVPTSAGGVTDIAARLVGPKLAEVLAQSLFIENRVGAGGVVASNMVAQAAPDGYTLIIVFDSFATNQYLYQGVQHDVVKDFAPISLLIKGPQLLVVHPSAGARTLKEFLQLARSKGSALSFATAGAGTSSRLSLELFKAYAGVEPTAIHYKGGAPAINALVGGQVPAMVTAMNVSLPHVKSGKLIALAVTSPKRLAVLPDVPTMSETFPGFEAQSWVGMLAPAATPRPIVSKLNASLHKVLAMPEVRSRFEAQGSEMAPSTPEAFGEWLRTETTKWAKIIKERKITLD